MINQLLNLELEDEKVNNIVIAIKPVTYEIDIKYPETVKHTKEELYNFLKNEVLSSL
jgi:sRNA-binding carbon storage regulator CsrA